MKEKIITRRGKMISSIAPVGISFLSPYYRLCRRKLTIGRGEMAKTKRDN